MEILRKRLPFDFGELYNKNIDFYIAKDNVSLECYYLSSEKVKNNAFLVKFIDNNTKQNLDKNSNIIYIEIKSKRPFKYFLLDYESYIFYRIEKVWVFSNLF